MQVITNQQPNSDITVTITSCGRLDLLQRTVDSLLATAGQDLKVLIFDDSSEPFEKLKDLYGTRFDLYKPDNPVGQAKALDFLYSRVKTPWLFHCEDDWEFLETDYIQQSKRILDQFPMVVLVGLNWDGSLEKYGAKGPQYCTEAGDFFIHKRWRISPEHGWWNGWIGSPNLKSTEDVKQFPPFASVNEESDWDRDVFAASGLVSVWLPKQYAKHIGDGRSLYPQGDKLKRSWLVPYSGTAAYTKEFHTAIEDSERDQAESLATILMGRYKLDSVCDAGCGTGTYLVPFKRSGIAVHGLDYSEVAISNALPEVSFGIALHDLGNEIDCSWWVDLCLCLETLEHISESKAKQAIENLVKIAGGTGRIIFSAAQPGQGGTGHINCQPKDYWRQLFALCGYVEDKNETQYILDEIQDKPHMGWLTNNLMVMRPASSPTSRPIFRFHLLGLAHLPTNVAMQSCFSSDTEVLTDQGWMLFSDIVKPKRTRGNIRVATLNRATGLVEYQHPTAYHDYKYVGKMFHQVGGNGSSLDIMVTPDHMLYVKHGSKPFDLVPAEKTKRHSKYKRDFPWPGGSEIKWFTLPIYKLRNVRTRPQRKFRMDDWLEFFGYYISEGNTDGTSYSRKDGSTVKNSHVTFIAQEKDPSKINKIKMCLDRMGLRYSHYKSGFVICDVQLATYLKQFGTSRKKYIPREYLCLAKRQMEILFDALVIGDGWTQGSLVRYVSYSKRLANDVHEMGLKLGYTCTMYSDPDPDVPRNIVTCSINRRITRPNSGKDYRKWVNYNGRVYCVTVPNSIIYVRRNGKCCWSGNCAYTQKVVKLAKMLKGLGHTVFFYGGEGSEVECDRYFTVVTAAERKACYGDYDWGKEFFKHDPKDRVHQAFNARCIAEIKANKREHDFLLCPMGTYDQPIADAVKLKFTVESGIGYSGVFAPFKIWESYGWMNHIYGMMKVENGAWYDAVIPNYWDPNDFHTGPKGDYHLFIGRLISRKGLSVAAEATERLGVKLIVAGQGDLAKVDGYDLTKYKHIEHIGTVNKEQRADLMAGALVTWVPTWYMAPFEGVHIESMFCGTPVLTTDWGCFPETNVHGLTGFRCRTMNEFLWGARKASELDPQKIRQYAIDHFSMDRVAQMYQAYFEQIWDIREYGWYQDRKEPGWQRSGATI